MSESSCDEIRVHPMLDILNSDRCCISYVKPDSFMLFIITFRFELKSPILSTQTDETKAFSSGEMQVYSTSHKSLHIDFANVKTEYLYSKNY